MKFRPAVVLWTGAALFGAVFVAPTLYAYPDSLQTCRELGGDARVRFVVDDDDVVLDPWTELGSSYATRLETIIDDDVDFDSDLILYDLDRSLLVVDDADSDSDLLYLTFDDFDTFFGAGNINLDDADFDVCQADLSPLNRVFDDFDLVVEDDDFDVGPVIFEIDNAKGAFDESTGNLAEASVQLERQVNHLQGLLQAPGTDLGDKEQQLLERAAEELSGAKGQLEGLSGQQAALSRRFEELRDAVSSLEDDFTQFRKEVETVNTQLGATQQNLLSVADTDGDGVSDAEDNCLVGPNPGQMTWRPTRYRGGMKVVSDGRLYECRGFPYDGWCGQAPYEPGVGRFWERAWRPVLLCEPPAPAVSDGKNCGDLPVWEKGRYRGGMQVQNEGSVYECRPFPFEGWCGRAGYEPGVGRAWQQAWVELGTCD